MEVGVGVYIIMWVWMGVGRCVGGCGYVWVGMGGCGLVRVGGCGWVYI